VYINRLYLMQIPVEKCYQTVKVEGEGEGEEEGTIDNGLDDSSITFDKSIEYIDEDDMEEVRALSFLYSRLYSIDGVIHPCFFAVSLPSLLSSD
jgi:hypothetical protein